jgi:uncharacterized protein YceK
MIRISAIATLLLGVAFLSGCSSTAKTSDAKEPQKKQTEEYVTVPVTGSLIGKRVKKSEAKTSEQDTAASQKALEDWQLRGSSASGAPPPVQR